MSILLGEARSSEDVDDLVDKNLVKYWKDLKKRPNIKRVFGDSFGGSVSLEL